MDATPFMTFAKLAEAVDFLASSLDRADIDAIAAQCVDAAHDRERSPSGLPSPHEYRTRAIRELAARHARWSLRFRYFFRKFPTNASSFKLGGHAKELGHVHVDFVRSEAGWQLKEIWICR